jgi:hypothetical protein
MEDKIKWSDSDIELLVNTCINYPWLWDSSREDFKDCRKKKNSFAAMAESGILFSDYGLPVQNLAYILKKKFDILRDTYMKCRRSEKGKSGDGAKVNRKTWKYFHLFSFMTESGQLRKTVDNMTEPLQIASVSETLTRIDTSIDDEDEFTQHIELSSEEFEQTAESLFQPSKRARINSAENQQSETSSSCMSPLAPIQPERKRKTSQEPCGSSGGNKTQNTPGGSQAHTDIDQEIVKALSSLQEKKTPNLHFSQYICSVLNGLPKKAQAAARHEISEVLKKYESDDQEMSNVFV